jgi:uracil-DNA glycosylase family protein
MLVGEQPGDHEDQEGRPFVGPAGSLLSDALAAAGLPRDSIYLTNTVKHFKWEARGKRRIHQKPNAAEVAACMPWLLAEIATVQPDIVVALGATAAQALLGRTFKVTLQRGRLLSLADGRHALATIHPSALLRMPDREAREEGFKQLVADLRVAGRAVKPLPAHSP